MAGQVRRRLHDALQENVATLLTPFTAFLLAEAMHASGVLAVVVCGLIMSQTGPRIGRADTRQQTTAFWTLATYLLNGALFVLIGLEAQSAVRNLSGVALTRGLGLLAVISAVVIGARFAWLFTNPYFIRLLDRRPQQRERRVGARPRVVVGVAGFRGAVSLAAALAVPQTLHSGAPFPDRDLIVFVTALRLAALSHKRSTVLRLRDEQRIDDTVLRQVQTRLDDEELRLSRHKHMR